MEITELESTYNIAVKEIKQAILESQYRAIKHVNAEQLSLYYKIGGYVSANSRNGYWGKGAIDYISNQLRKEMPGLKGFSATNMKMMRIFFEEWTLVKDKSSVTTDEIQNEANPAIMTAELLSSNDDLLIRQSRLTNLSSAEVQSFLQVPFSHHYIILSRVKTLEERLFYIQLCEEEHLTARALPKAIDADEFHHKHQLPSNFRTNLPKSELLQKAILAFKDEYMLDFINTEELGVRDIEDVDEKVVENLIVNNIKNFIMTFGRDFTFMGNQYHVEALGHDHYIDLLFFNRELSSLVAVELKNGPFKPSYLGQLNSYLRVLDDYVRKPNENPSIGIVLCRDADKRYVEYVAQDYEKPMGVAVYHTFNEMPERLRNALPDMEELKKLL